MTTKTLNHYQNHAIALTNRYETARVTSVQSHLLSITKNCTSVLELGCGSGRDAAFLLKNHPSLLLTATDGSNNMLKQANSLHPELSNHLKQLKIPEQISMLNDKYDCVYSIATLMHLNENEIQETLLAISGVMQKNGILFISVSIQRNKQQQNDTRLFTLKSKKWWKEQINRSGFSITFLNENIDSLKRENVVWLNIISSKKP